MHYGVVNEYLEPVIILNISGTGNTSLVVDFVIDTGCTEEIILPQDLIRGEPFQLAPAEEIHMHPGIGPADGGADITVTLADGTSVRHARYPAQIDWHGERREIVAVSMGIEPLIGMGILQGSNLSVDAVPDGSVTITELSS